MKRPCDRLSGVNAIMTVVHGPDPGRTSAIVLFCRADCVPRTGCVQARERQPVAELRRSEAVVNFDNPKALNALPDAAIAKSKVPKSGACPAGKNLRIGGRGAAQR